MPLEPGLYDTPITESLRKSLVEALAELVALDRHGSALAIGRLLYDRLVPALDSLTEVEAQIELANAVLALVRSKTKGVVVREPPTYQVFRPGGWGTLYTAVYDPVARSAEYCWPGGMWTQSLADFQEGTVAIDYTAHPK